MIIYKIQFPDGTWRGKRAGQKTTFEKAKIWHKWGHVVSAIRNMINVGDSKFCYVRKIDIKETWLESWFVADIFEEIKNNRLNKEKELAEKIAEKDKRERLKEYLKLKKEFEHDNDS